MKSDRVLVLAQCMLAVAIVATVSTVIAGGLPAPTTAAANLPAALALGLALLVLGFFNVWLPRGDAVDTTVPIAFAASILLHPLVAAGVVLLARAATIALRPKGHTAWTAMEQVSRRVILMSAAYALVAQAASRGLGSGQPGAQTLVLLTAASAAFIALDALVEQAHAALRFRAPVRALVVGALRLQGWMLAAEMSTAVLAVVLYGPLGIWGLLPTVGLLLVMRQSFALLLEVRASYTSTVEVLARSMEAYDKDRRGHAERVAHMCGEAGRMVGLQGKRLESLTYAALFHDVGRLGADSLDELPERASAEILAGVGFIAGALPILRILDSGGEDESSLDEDDLISAFLVARFSVLDSEISSGRIESKDLATAVGARLYSSTRAAVDRAVGRVEAEARAGSLPVRNLTDVLT